VDRVDAPRSAPAATGALSLRPLLPEETALSADWHVRHLRHGFFPQLGRDFVRRWHRTFVDTPAGRAEVAERDGAVVAVLLGAVDQAAYVTQVIAGHRWPLVRRAALALLLRPRTAGRFVTTRAGRYARRLLRRGAADGPAAPRPQGPQGGSRPVVAVVHVLITDPTARGSGAARALVERFSVQARTAGAESVEIVTVDGEGGAAGFYRRLGWTDLGAKPDKDGVAVRRFRLPLEEEREEGLVFEEHGARAPLHLPGAPP